MTDSELLSMATRFVVPSAAGSPITVERCERRAQPPWWAVRHLGYVLGKDGQWMIEPSPSSRDEAFYCRFRFDTRDEAFAAAAKDIQVES